MEKQEQEMEALRQEMESMRSSIASGALHPTAGTMFPRQIAQRESPPAAGGPHQLNNNCKTTFEVDTEVNTAKGGEGEE